VDLRVWLLQTGDPINPNRIRPDAGVGDRGGEIIQDLIEACHHGIPGWRLDRLVILNL